MIALKCAATTTFINIPRTFCFTADTGCYLFQFRLAQRLGSIFHYLAYLKIHLPSRIQDRAIRAISGGHSTGSSLTPAGFDGPGGFASRPPSLRMFLSAILQRNMKESYRFCSTLVLMQFFIKSHITNILLVVFVSLRPRSFFPSWSAVFPQKTHSHHQPPF